MIFITDENEIQLKNYQLIYFYSSWFVFHSKMMFMLNLSELKYNNVSFLAIDVDEFKNQCKRFSINVVPTVLILKEGKEINRLEGVFDTKKIIESFADICIV